MANLAEAHCEALRGRFEGRHAIYVEAGVVCVRVVSIRPRPASRHVAADIEEVSGHHTAGGRFHPQPESARRWTISGAHLMEFSENTWRMGYGGWSLFFAPHIIAGLADLAVDWAPELTADERYKRALLFLLDQRAYESSERVFPD